MKIEHQYVPTGQYTSSLESMYIPSSVRESRRENRTAVLLNVAIIAALLALIGFGGTRDHGAQHAVEQHQGR